VNRVFFVNYILVNSSTFVFFYEIPAILAIHQIPSLKYARSPLSADASFSRVASALRVSSPQHLDFPSLHNLSRRLIEAMFPSGPVPFFHPDCLEEALALATEYQITSVSDHSSYFLLISLSNSPLD
jgi:hypothetical protein